MPTTDHYGNARPAQPLWQKVLVLLVMLGLGWAALRVFWYVDGERRAPVIIDTLVYGCALSPAKHFMLVSGAGFEPGDFFDIHTNSKVHVAVPAEIISLQRSFWLHDDVLFYYSQLSDSDSYESIIIQNGLLIDVAHRVVTDVLTLDPRTQQSTLAAANQRFHPVGPLTSTVLNTAPNGEVYFTPTVIRRVADDKVMNRIEGGTGPNSDCINAWRPDSSGYYFIDRGRAGIGRTEPGPMRLLLTHPWPDVP